MLILIYICFYYYIIIIIIIIIIIRFGFNNWVIIEAELIETITLIILTRPKKYNYNWNNTLLKKKNKLI